MVWYCIYFADVGNGYKVNSYIIIFYHVRWVRLWLMSFYFLELQLFDNYFEFF